MHDFILTFTLYSRLTCLFSATNKQKMQTLNPPCCKRGSVDPLCPQSALVWPSLWHFSSSQQERKWLSQAALNSPSTGRKSGLNEAVSRIGHAVRAHHSSHPLIRLQYFQHPLNGKRKKQSQENWAELHLWCNRLMMMELCRCSQVVKSACIVFLHTYPCSQVCMCGHVFKT